MKLMAETHVDDLCDVDCEDDCADTEMFEMPDSDH